MDLMGADALLAGGHQEQCGQPLGQRNLGTLENRLHGHGELVTALGALVEARTMGLALKRLDLGLIDVATMRANRAIRPNPSLKPFAGFGFVVENGVFEHV